MKKPFRLPVKKLGFWANLKIRGKLRSLKKNEEPASHNFFYNNRYAMSTAFLLLIGVFAADLFMIDKPVVKIPRNNSNKIIINRQQVNIPQVENKIQLDKPVSRDFKKENLEIFSEEKIMRQVPRNDDFALEETFDSALPMEEADFSNTIAPASFEANDYYQEDIVGEVLNDWLESSSQDFSVEEIDEIRSELDEFFAENPDLNKLEILKKLKNILKNR